MPEELLSRAVSPPVLSGAGVFPADLLLQAVEHASFGITLADAQRSDLPLIYANRAFHSITGYGRAESLGANCRFLQGPDTDPEVVASIREAIRLGLSGTFLLLNYRKDGSRFWNRFQLSPVCGPDGDLVAYFGMQVDITDDIERIGLETERQKLETLGRLAGGVAHELNNALQPIRLYADILNDQADLAADTLKTCAEGIRDHVQFAGDIVGQILAFARREPGAEQLFDAQRVVAEAVDFATEFLAAGMTVERHGFGAVGPCRGQEIRVNRTALLQVFANLFKNAADACGDSGRIEVRLSLRWVVGRTGLGRPADTESALWPHIAVEVADDGPGIAPEDLRSIFEPFFTTKAPGQGTGLGLSTVYGIVERWGGRVLVESPASEGTCFTILIPLFKEAIG